MKLRSLLLILLTPSIALCNIYKTVDPQGQTTFTDQASSDSKPVQLPQVQTYAPTLKPQTTQPLPVESNNPVENYKSISILSPQNDEALRQNEGTVVVQMDVKPELKEDNKIQLIMDNANMGPPQTSTTFVLTNVDRGTHSIQGKILDAQGNALITSPPVTFHLLRYNIRSSTSLQMPNALPLTNLQIENLKSLQTQTNNASNPSK
jgi:hypothetical protein